MPDHQKKPVKSHRSILQLVRHKMEHLLQLRLLQYPSVLSFFFGTPPLPDGQSGKSVEPLCWWHRRSSVSPHQVDTQTGLSSRSQHGQCKEYNDPRH